ncbi:MAG: fatty acid CoA ligase family protein [bacterium]
MTEPAHQLTVSYAPDWKGESPWSAEPTAKFNIANYLPARAAERPGAKAIVMPEGYNALGKRAYSHLTFAQLNALCDAYAHGLVAQGFKRGDKTLLMVSQGLELIALTFALFKIGAVPVLIDPGMGREGFLRCIADNAPVAMLGIPKAFVAKLLFPKAFRSIQRAVSTKKVFISGAPGLDQIARFDLGEFPIADTDRDELAAILFTSGSTGPAKGVQYTHGIFDAQTRAIQEMYSIQPGEVAVPGFPLFALFSTAMGMTCVVPDMDPSQPAAVNPANIVEAVLDHDATMAFGSPAIWNSVANYCEKNAVRFPSMTRLLTFGAPISPLMMERYRAILPNGAIHTPYGATEGLPVSSISSVEVLGSTQEMSKSGKGMCIGKPVDSVTVRIIEITDEPLENWSDVVACEAGKIGEICVTGPQITRRYDNRDDATKASKILDDSVETGFWHRMGDVGYFDDEGRLWFCGRKSHRVETENGTLHSVPVEAIFENHDDVYRAAMVWLGERGKQTPVVVIEPMPGKMPTGNRVAEFEKELLELAKSSTTANAVEHILFHLAFPVDKRHNAKIHREELAVFAANSMKKLS